MDVIVSCEQLYIWETGSHHVIHYRDSEILWNKYQEKFQKGYANGEEAAKRRATFEENVKRITQHNLEEDLGLHSYRMGLNQFTDMVSINCTNTHAISSKLKALPLSP